MHFQGIISTNRVLFCIKVQLSAGVTKGLKLQIICFDGENAVEKFFFELNYNVMMLVPLQWQLGVKKSLEWNKAKSSRLSMVNKNLQFTEMKYNR